VVAPTGEIKKLSVAVLVDGTYQVGAKGERQYVPRSAEELAKYREIVKSAVGFNESRGDRVGRGRCPLRYAGRSRGSRYKGKPGACSGSNSAATALMSSSACCSVCLLPALSSRCSAGVRGDGG
jgi:hypothetical protein